MQHALIGIVIIWILLVMAFASWVKRSDGKRAMGLSDADLAASIRCAEVRGDTQSAAHAESKRRDALRRRLEIFK